MFDEFYNNREYQALGVSTPIDPVTVEFQMTQTAELGTGGEVRLVATADTGIVAVDDGGTWGGVDMLLPT